MARFLCRGKLDLMTRVSPSIQLTRFHVRSDYLNMQRSWNDRSPYVNQSLFNPEWIYGMMSPTAPATNKALIWHTYSAQAYGIFHGDLDFYFVGCAQTQSFVESLD